MKTTLRFSRENRAAIAKQAIGKPTDVTVEVGGITIALVPITTEQADEVFSILESFGKLSAQAENGIAQVSPDFLAAMIPTEGRRIRKVLRSYLLESAKASDLVDDGCEDVFDEWFARLPLLDTIRTMLPKIVEAQGLGTMLGNSSTPPAEPALEAVPAGTASP